MTQTLKSGSTKTITITIDETHTAQTHGSGDLPVYATPAMIAHMEQAAAMLAAPYLDEGDSTVGIAVSIEHIAATPIGREVRITATLRGIDRRRLVFDVEAHDEKQQIGRGTHERFIINKQKFMERL